MVKVLRCFFGTLGIGLVLIGIVSLVILIKIGGKSDGPGALIFYIGLFAGFGGGFIILASLPPKG
jgi:hypothetical protein